MWVLMPEFFLIGCFTFYFVLSLSRVPWRIRPLSKGLALLAFFLTLITFGEQGEFFSGALKVDTFTQVFKAICAFGFFLVFCLLKPEGEDHEEGYLHELYGFLTLSLLGLMVLVSAEDLLSLFIALELSSYCLYVILPLRKGGYLGSVEGSLKYVFFGAVCSALALYGMGYLYALSGTTKLGALVVEGGLFSSLGLLLFSVAFFFKLSLFPFHFWAPDVYQGASNSVAAFIASVPKVAALAVLLKIIGLFPQESKGLKDALWVIAVLSMTFGNLAALVQKDLKRLMAYSGIAHGGYVVLGLLEPGIEAKVAVSFYALVYLLMTLGVFLVLVGVSEKGKDVLIEDLSGLYSRSPLFAFTLAVSAFSLIGIPPTGGFMGKLFLFVVAYKAGHKLLVLIALVNTVLSLFYYLNMVRLAYSKESLGPRSPLVLSTLDKVLCLTVSGLLLLLGVFPSPWTDFLYKVAV